MEPTTRPEVPVSSPAPMPVPVSATEQKYAGFGRRFLAYNVDALILFGLSWLVTTTFGQNSWLILSQAKSMEELQAASTSTNGLLSSVIVFGMMFVYYLIFWVNYHGATPGKKLVGIKIVRDSGEPVGYPVAIIRMIGLLISFGLIGFLGLPFLMAIWDKKKQALHDKIAGTVVLQTGSGRVWLAVLLTVLYIATLIGLGGFVGFNMVSLTRQEVEKNRGEIQETRIQERLENIKELDKDKILTYAATSCDMSLAIPKTTDTKEGVDRKWLLEEVEVDPSNFFILDKDLYPMQKAQGVFLGYKDASARMGGGSFSVAFPGMNMYCVDNTKGLTLEEYKSAVLAGKDNTVEVQDKTLWGEVEVYPVVVSGTDKTTAKEFKDFGYLAVSKDKGKLLYMRIWAVDEKDPIKDAIGEDVNIITRNLMYRTTSADIPAESNTNVRGASTSVETIQAL